ncbi:MAG: Y Y Y domain-containing protein [Saprospirales bacterium]|nr:MAG: Y Y Y domain-containing protein [Saprospirales bacterium]
MACKILSLTSRFVVSLFFCTGLTLSSSAAGLPPVISFSPEDYLADNQNWSITQSSEDHIFVANNKGMLEYNGDSWRLYPTPNESIIRSVYYSDGRIYSGCFRDFGYWERDLKGKMVYKSLVESLKIEPGDNEEFWTILSYNSWILFQSLDAIYFYNSSNGDVRMFEFDEGITKMIRLRNEIYFSIPRKGIYKIVDGAVSLVNDHPVFRGNPVVNMYKKNGQILVQTITAGIYTLEDEPAAWGYENEGLLSGLSVYNSMQSRAGNLLLGTISDGLVKVDATGDIVYQITKDQFLTDNTVLSVFEDRSGNIWIGLDNGIACINQNSPVSIFYDRTGKLGTVYSSIIHNDRLYLGTNQGLFYKKWPVESRTDEFHMVSGSVGQVWDLFVYNDQLFCGHNDGTFLIKENQLVQISDLPGTWCFKSIPERPDLLLQGNYKGLSILEATGDNWRLRNELSGFNISSRYIEFIDKSSLLVAHEYKGVYRLELDDDYRNVVKVEKIPSAKQSLYSSITSFNGDILYSNEYGIWRYDLGKSGFAKDSFLSSLYKGYNYSSGKLVTTRDERDLWTFSKESMHYVSPGKFSDDLNVISIPIHYSVRNAMVGYENMLETHNSNYLFGNSQGYFLIDLDGIKNRQLQSELSLYMARTWTLNQEEEKLLALNADAVLSNRYNNIEFSFSLPEFEKYFTTEFQYQLEGVMVDYSDWNTVNRAVFNNLDYGTYDFRVRGRIGEKYTTEAVTFSFVIERPFVLSNLMIFLYFLLIVVLFLIVHSTYRNYYRKQREKLEQRARKELDFQESENKRNLMRLNNEKLKQEINGKNRELAISTMSLIKKNKALNTIKTELNKLNTDSGGLKRVVKLINSNLKSSDDWDFFERAFNNADRDFFKKIKAKHSNLTPDDLRLCAFLRLNLSSKEIAPLLGISPKSVEIKRYRLRKKMELSSEVNLTEYILEV